MLSWNLPVGLRHCKAHGPVCTIASVLNSRVHSEMVKFKFGSVGVAGAEPWLECTCYGWGRFHSKSNHIRRNRLFVFVFFSLYSQLRPTKNCNQCENVWIQCSFPPFFSLFATIFGDLCWQNDRMQFVAYLNHSSLYTVKRSFCVFRKTSITG